MSAYRCQLPHVLYFNNTPTVYTVHFLNVDEFTFTVNVRFASWNQYFDMIFVPFDMICLYIAQFIIPKKQNQVHT